MNLQIKSIVTSLINRPNNDCHRINNYHSIQWQSIISIKSNNTMISKIIIKSKINTIYAVNKFFYFIAYLVINFCLSLIFYNKF